MTLIRCLSRWNAVLNDLSFILCVVEKVVPLFFRLLAVLGGRKLAQLLKANNDSHSNYCIWSLFRLKDNGSNNEEDAFKHSTELFKGEKTKMEREDVLVGQCSAEMLLDIRLQHRVEVLEFPVSDQADDVDLADRGGYEAAQWTWRPFREEELSLTGTSEDFWHRKPGTKSVLCTGPLTNASNTRMS